MDDEEQWGYRIDIRCGVQGRGHRKRGVAITSFVHDGDGRWHEYVVSPWSEKHLTDDVRHGPDSGTTLAGDSPHIDHDRVEVGSEYARTLRTVYTLVCPVCSPERTAANTWYGFRRAPGASVDLTEPQLFAALNHARHAGIRDLELALLSGIVQHMAKA